MARYPVLTIALSLLATGLTFIGFLNFKWETDTVKLWLPQGSEFVKVCRASTELIDTIFDIIMYYK